MNEYIQEDKIEDLLTKELDVLENAISDDNDALAICSREEIWKLIYRLNEQSYNRGVEDSLKCVPEPKKIPEKKELPEKYKDDLEINDETYPIVMYNAFIMMQDWSHQNAHNDCRQQTIDNINKLLTNK